MGVCPQSVGKEVIEKQNIPLSSISQHVLTVMCAKYSIRAAFTVQQSGLTSQVYSQIKKCQ